MRNHSAYIQVSHLLNMRQKMKINSLCFIAITILSSCSQEPTSLDRNNPPQASFTVKPPSGDIETIFKFDASGSNDNEDKSSLLEVRWDLENDGSWNTEYLLDKTITHQFKYESKYNVKMQVRDTEGLTDSSFVW